MQVGYTYTSRDLLRHSVSARRGMRLRIFDARRARSEHARGFGPDDDPSPRARFPGGARRGDPFSTMRQPFDEAHLGEARDVAARRGRRARAAPRCAARERAPTCGGQARPPVGTAVPEDAGRERSRSLKPSASSSTIHPEAPSCRFCFEGPAFGALISPCACSGTQAHVHIKCLRRWQRTTRSADGGRTCQVCRRMFLAPPLSFYERSARAAWRAAQARAAPFALLSARLAVDLAREESAASVLRGRGPLALAAAVVAFLMDCERLHRFSAADIWENAHAHLATVALQAALTKAVERSARAFRAATLRDGSEGGASLYVADPMAGWVHFAHDVLNFPHLMTLCYGILCADAERAPAVAAVRGMRGPGPGPPRAPGGGAAGRLETAVAAALEALGSSSAGFDDIGVVAEARRALLAGARWLERAIEAAAAGAASSFARGGDAVLDAARRDARRFFGDAFVPSR